MRVKKSLTAWKVYNLSLKRWVMSYGLGWTLANYLSPVSVYLCCWDTMPHCMLWNKSKEGLKNSVVSLTAQLPTSNRIRYRCTKSVIVLLTLRLLPAPPYIKIKVSARVWEIIKRNQSFTRQICRDLCAHWLHPFNFYGQLLRVGASCAGVHLGITTLILRTICIVFCWLLVL